MRYILSIIMLLAIATTLRAQADGCCYRPADSYATASTQMTTTPLPAEITKAFATAATTTKKDRWLEVHDASHKLLGYAVYSKPASDGITGYAGETPLLIAFDTTMHITSVQLLKNDETHFVVDKVLQSPLLGSWNGLTAKEARKRKVDAVTGATYTSTSIIQSMRAAMKRLAK